MLALYLFGGIAALFVMVTAVALFHSRRVHRLPAMDALLPGAPKPRCSVILAARDEAARIENTVRRVLAQQDVDVEVIVVDDRSQDDTPKILAQLAREDHRVCPVRVDALPDGWLGKCHACHVGATRATGEWILFTDADCWMKPDVLVRALREAARERVDHVTLTPGVAPETVGGQAWHLAFLISLSILISALNRDHRKAYFGIGAFNLVRASAYRKSGGYEALRLTVLDDVKLGLLLKRSGTRTRAFIGGDDVECHWGTTATSMIKIMEKNYFAAMEYRTAKVIVVIVCAVVIWGGALVGPFTGTPAGIAAGAGLLSLTLPAGVLARKLGWGFEGALAAPFIYPWIFYSMLNSALVTLRQGGVRWRDTFYPLERLRAGNLK